MGTNTLSQRFDGVPMPASWFNDLRSAMLLNFVPRGANGIPTNEAGSLGDADYQWLEARVKRIFLDGNLLDPGIVTGKPHRITAAAQNSTTKYPEFLTPAGAGNGLSCILAATATPFEAIINNVTTEVSADTTFSSLTAAPGSNNTCLIDDIALAGAESTKTLGELDGKPITIDTIGSEISDRQGEIAAFKLGTEIFLAEIDTDNNRLLPIYRGWAGTSRIGISNNDTITLMQFNVLLLKNDGSTKLASIYYPQTITTSPAAGTAGKIYIERETNKIGYDTGAAIDYSYMILGYAICDSADCINAQIYDMELSWNSEISVEYQIKEATTIAIQRNSQLSVNGKNIFFSENYDITQASNMDSGESISADKQFYIYMKEDGSAVFSTVAPRKYDAIKKGMYHPLKYFRWVGSILTNGSHYFKLKRGEKKNLERIRDEILPVGSIVAWTGLYYGDGSNGSGTNILGQRLTLKAMLQDEWKVCDGSEIYDPESPIFNGAGRFIENLTDDRFLMGDSDAGSIGGSNTTPSLAHSHDIAHAHQWSYSYYPSLVLMTLNSIDDSKASITNGDDIFGYVTNMSDDGSGFYVLKDKAVGDGASVNHYTSGVLSPPGGTAGSGALSGSSNPSADNRPKWLGCIYIRKIK